MQPDDDPYKCELCGEYYCEHGQATMGHAGHWITLAERKADEAIENYRANREQTELVPPAPMAARSERRC